MIKAVVAVQKLQPYIPGKPIEELQRELGLDSIIKLASNENPLGASEKVKAALTQELNQLTRYPDGNGFILKKALSEKYSVELNQITLGNGSNDVLELIARAFLNEQTSAIYSQHAFAVYPISVQAVGAQAIVTPAKNWGHDLVAMADAVVENTRVIFLANPNNPTGTWFTRAELTEFMSRVPKNVVVVLDEAYCEYAQPAEYPNGLDFLAEYENLIITRTFSKAYGLAALRIGYALSSPELADILNRVRQPFNVNHFALVAASIALQDNDYLEQTRALNQAGMQQLEQGFAELNLSYIPSIGNFIAVDFSIPSGDIYQALLKSGVIVRPVANYQMPTFLRVSIGIQEENQRFLAALTQVLTDRY